MDLSLLEKAFENDNNLSIINKTIEEIKSKKNDVLQNLGLKKEELKILHSKLRDYMYIDIIEDIKYGHNIRWINLKQMDNIKLTKCAIICDIKIYDKGICLIVKTYNNRHITIYCNECLIFKKISPEENILLKALNLLNK